MSWADVIGHIPAKILTYLFGLTALAAVALVGATLVSLYITKDPFYIAGLKFGPENPPTDVAAIVKRLVPPSELRQSFSLAQWQSVTFERNEGAEKGAIFLIVTAIVPGQCVFQIQYRYGTMSFDGKPIFDGTSIPVNEGNKVDVLTTVPPGEKYQIWLTEVAIPGQHDRCIGTFERIIGAS